MPDLIFKLHEFYWVALALIGTALAVPLFILLVALYDSHTLRKYEGRR